MTSTINTLVAFSKVIEACCVHTRGQWSRDLCTTMPELTTSRCSIPRTVHTNALVDHGSFPAWAEMKCSRSSFRIRAVYYMISWTSFTLIWVHSHPLIACCFLFLLQPVLQMIFKCASWDMFCGPHWRHCGGLTGVCGLAVGQRVMY